MPYYTFKRSWKNRCLVLRWKKRINGVPTIIKEMSVGPAANLASMLENGLNGIVLKSYSASSTLSVMYIDRKIGFRDAVNTIMGHRGNGMSPGDYIILLHECVHIRCINEHIAEVIAHLHDPIPDTILYTLDIFIGESIHYIPEVL